MKGPSWLASFAPWLGATRLSGRGVRAGRWIILAAAVVLVWPLRREAWTSVLLPALSPYAALGSVLATRSVTVLALLAAPALLLALRFPRCICRQACPAGLLQEMAGGLRPSALGRWQRFPRVGEWVVLMTLGGACLGSPLFLWLDPMALLQAFLNAWRWPLTVATLLTGLGLPLLLLLALARPGLWCRRICPLGATQDLLAWPGQRVCRNTHGQSPETFEEAAQQGPALGRRSFLGGCAGAAGALVARVARGSSPLPLRPPGSLDEDRFTSVCLRCGNCARACPSHIIRPDLGRSGVPGFLTPALCFEADYCREDCHRCLEVCPSGAITRLSLTEKRRRVIGPALVDLEACLLANGRECTACLKSCPYQALAMHSTDGGFSYEPRLDPGKCTGCGACEAVCPVRPRRAIRVSAKPGLLTCLDGVQNLRV
jgi:ferredoxin-type protein NapF